MRENGVQEVAGSNPVAPTTNLSTEPTLGIAGAIGPDTAPLP